MNSRYNFVLIYALWFLTIIFSSCQHEKVLNSPDGHVRVTFDIVEGLPVYSLGFDGKTIIENSPLGLIINNKPYQNLSIESIETSQIDETWQPVWGKVSMIRNRCNEWQVHLLEKNEQGRSLTIIMRAYDDGIAIRYQPGEAGDDEPFTVTEDLTHFNFTDDHTWWSANGENANLGPLPLSRAPENILTPMVIRCDRNRYLAIHEAGIYEFAKMTLTPSDDKFSLKSHMASSSGISGDKTSWRTILLGRHPGDLIESNLLVNLNPPCKIDDPSWVAPGKTMWDWRVWGYVAPDGFEYGLNTVSHKRFVDFAAGHNIRYMLLDADWYGPEFSETSNPTSARSGIDIEDFMAYAKAKNVKVLLYLNDVGAKKYGLENILSKFHEWGAAGVKYGFMRDKGQKKVRNTRKIVELCAKYDLLVDFHDNPIPPSGDRRTWPNLVTREYCHSQADAKKSYFPETAVSSAFINMIAGPLDMCNGWYGLTEAENRVKVFQPIPGTVAAETAKLIVFYSGLSVLPDAPEEYMKKADIFTIIESLPDTYDEMRVLGGDIDSYITVARRKGDNWYVGSLTNREARTLEIPLTFLARDVEYKALIGEDTPSTHYIDNKERYNVRDAMVTAASVIKAKLAPGGGFAMRLRPSDNR